VIMYQMMLSCSFVTKNKIMSLFLFWSYLSCHYASTDFSLLLLVNSLIFLQLLMQLYIHSYKRYY